MNEHKEETKMPRLMRINKKTKTVMKTGDKNKNLNKKAGC